ILTIDGRDRVAPVLMRGELFVREAIVIRHRSVIDPTVISITARVLDCSARRRVCQQHFAWRRVDQGACLEGGCRSNVPASTCTCSEPAGRKTRLASVYAGVGKEEYCASFLLGDIV